MDVLILALGILSLLCSNISAQQPGCSTNRTYAPLQPQQQPYSRWHPVANRNLTLPSGQDPQQPYLIMFLLPNGDQGNSALVSMPSTILQTVLGNRPSSTVSNVTTASPSSLRSTVTHAPRATTRPHRVRSRGRHRLRRTTIISVSQPQSSTSSVPQTSTNGHPQTSTTPTISASQPQSSTSSVTQTSTNNPPNTSITPTISASQPQSSTSSVTQTSTNNPPNTSITPTISASQPQSSTSSVPQTSTNNPTNTSTTPTISASQPQSSTSSVPQTSTNNPPNTSITPTISASQPQSSTSSVPQTSTNNPTNTSTTPTISAYQPQSSTSSVPQTSTNNPPNTSITPTISASQPQSSTSSVTQTSTNNPPNTSTTPSQPQSSTSSVPLTSTVAYAQTSTSPNPDVSSRDNYPNPSSSSSSPSSAVSTRDSQQLGSSTSSSSPNANVSTTVYQQSSTSNSTLSIPYTGISTTASPEPLPESRDSNMYDYATDDTSYSNEYDSEDELNSEDCDSGDYSDYCNTEDPSDVGNFRSVEAETSNSSNSENSRNLHQQSSPGTTTPGTTVPTSETSSEYDDEYESYSEACDTSDDSEYCNNEDPSDAGDYGFVEADTSNSSNPVSSTTTDTSAASRDPQSASVTPRPSHTTPTNRITSTTTAPVTSARHHTTHSDRTITRHHHHHHHHVNTSSPHHHRRHHTNTSSTPADHQHANTLLPPADRHRQYHANTSLPQSTTTPHNINFWPCVGSSPRNSSYETVSQMLRHNGYQSEAHVLRTDDGYLLCLHRIPHGRNTRPRPNRTAVLLQHGIPGSSADWVIAGRNRGLAYLLADAGYDVWMANSRGNNYSTGHQHLDTHGDQYWSFSLDEMARYDMPAVVDHILHQTQQTSLYVVTQSTGSAVLLAMLSLMPCYNYNIRAMYHLAPAVYLANNTDFQNMRNHVGIGPFNVTPQLLQQFGVQRCLSERDVPEAICRNFRFLVGGYNPCNISTEVLAALIRYSFAGTSDKAYLHYSQILTSGVFRQFDYGPLGNLILYSSRTPPEYHLDLVTAPSSIFYSELDPVVGHREVNWLQHELSNIVEVRHVPYFTHWDFLWGPRARADVYNHILQEMQQLNQSWWPQHVPHVCAPMSTR